MEAAEAFIEAVKAGDRAVIEQMIGREPLLVNARSANGVSAVLWAVYYGQPAIVKLLIDRGAQLDIFDAAATGQLERVKTLLAEDTSRVNAVAADGFQPLGLACFFGHPALAELLVSKGAEVNSPSKNGQRVQPLHSSVANQHLEITKMLLAHGADVNATQADDFTPLHEAAHNGQLDMVRLLLSYGADKTAKKAGGQTALDLALEKGYTEAAALLK